MITFVISSLLLSLLFIFLLKKIWRTEIYLPIFSVFAAGIIYFFVGTFEKESMEIVTSANQAILTETVFMNNNESQKKLSSKSMNEMITKLEKSLNNNNLDLNGWVLLAKVKFIQKKYVEASNAYKNALKISPDDPDLLSELADTLALIQGSLVGEPFKLVKKALIINPNHQKSLMLGATAAITEKQNKYAVELLNRLKQTVDEKSADAIKITKIIETLKIKTSKGITKQKTLIKGILKIEKKLALNVLKMPDSQNFSIFIFVKDIKNASIPIAAIKFKFQEFKNNLLLNEPISFELNDNNSIRKDLKLSSLKKSVVQAKLSFKGVAGTDIDDLFSNEIEVSIPKKRIVLNLKSK